MSNLAFVSTTWKANCTVADWVVLAQVIRRNMPRESINAASSYMTQDFIGCFQNEIRKGVAKAKPNKLYIGWSNIVAASSEVAVDVIIMNGEGGQKM